jgi:hypothetical protein
MPEEKYSLLRDAYAVIDGIPEAQFNLESIIRRRSGINECRTIACAAGWLSIHPTFGPLLKAEVDGSLVNWRTERGPTGHFVTALSEPLGLTPDETRRLFGMREYYEPVEEGRVPGAYLSDKELWKARVRNFLAEKGAL